MYVCMYVCMCIYIYIYIHLSLSLSLYIYICICVYIYICICVYIYIYIYIPTSQASTDGLQNSTLEGESILQSNFNREWVFQVRSELSLTAPTGISCHGLAD